MPKEEWVDVLEEIYDESDFWEMNQSRISELEDKTGHSEEEIEEMLNNLRKQGLIKRDMEDIILTKRGFEFISEKKTHEEQMITQRLLLVFVTALALATFVDTVMKVQEASFIVSAAYSAIFAIVFIVLGMVAKQNLS